MRVGICDDEIKELNYLQSLVNKFNPSFETFLYQSAESMFEGIRKLPVDVLLLDIEMGGMNGFDAAKELAKTENPPLIVFVTNSAGYAYRGYEVAYRYIPKPVKFESICEALSAAADKISSQKISISSAGKTHVLPHDVIVYVVASGHGIVLHTKKDEYECRMNLSEIKAMLPDNIFVSAHKSCLVNLNYVDIVEAGAIMLVTNQKVPLSRRRRQDFEKKLHNFVRAAR